MVSSEVQRTLVKSPPELWAELSDPAALARHLGELGEIRITKVKPEERVEWEADGISGTVAIKASGWGTKVTLSVTREVDEASVPVLAEPEIELEVTEPLAQPEPEVAPVAEPSAQPEPEIEPSGEPAPEPRRGFFSRLFRRRSRPNLEPEPVALAEPELNSMPVSEPMPEAPVPERPREETVEQISEQTTDISAELLAAEEAAAEEATAVLTAALDRLGAAHHRPFSRS
jgi:hypothetical protein